MSEKKEVQSRGWCFTVNNPTDDELAHIGCMYENFDNIEYVIAGKEKGKKGTPHLQCYVYFKSPLRWSNVKDYFPVDAKWHYEAQKASENVKAYCYCMKEDDYVEYGERPRQGHRTNLEVIKHDLKKHRNLKKVAEENFSQWCQYRRAFEEYLHMISEDETQLITYQDFQIAEVMDYIYSEAKDIHVCHSLYDNQPIPKGTKVLLYTFAPVESNYPILYSQFRSKKYKYIIYQFHPWRFSTEQHLLSFRTWHKILVKYEKTFNDMFDLQGNVPEIT